MINLETKLFGLDIVTAGKKTLWSLSAPHYPMSQITQIYPSLSPGAGEAEKVMTREREKERKKEWIM